METEADIMPTHQKKYKDPRRNYLCSTEDCEILQPVGGSRLLSVKMDTINSSQGPVVI